MSDTLYCAVGNKVYKWLEKDDAWQAIREFEADIECLTVSKGCLYAMVGEKTVKL